jgi:uncharacterized membrane-anchored protein
LAATPQTDAPHFKSTLVAIIAVLRTWFMTIVLMSPTAPDVLAPAMSYTVVVMSGALSLALGYYYFPH